jgi:peptidoglycan/LPS O-acetylase OafA/YrhL
MVWGFQNTFGWTREHDPNHAVYFLALTAATVAVASVSWFAFERPINGLKRYFPYSERQATSQSAAGEFAHAESA